MKRYLSIILIALFAFASHVTAAHVHDDADEDHGDTCALCLLAHHAPSTIVSATHDFTVGFFVPVKQIVPDTIVRSSCDDTLIPRPRAPPPV